MLGAGIVGLSTAYSLLLRGASVTVYERGVPGLGDALADAALGGGRRSELRPEARLGLPDGARTIRR